MSLFDKTTLALTPLKYNSAALKKATLHGKAAIKAIEAREGRKLTPSERRVVELEGFVPVPYLDEDGNVTIGVGQTGKWMRKTFKESYDNHVEKISSKIDNFETLPDALQTELIQSAYRGGILLSTKTRKLINQGDYSAAALEFLDNDEYRDTKTSDGVKSRMKDLSLALARTEDDTGQLDNDAKDIALPSAAAEDVQETSEVEPTASMPEGKAPETAPESRIQLSPNKLAIVDRIRQERALKVASVRAEGEEIERMKLSPRKQAIVDRMIAEREGTVANTAINREAGRTVEGMAGREERMQEVFDRGNEDDAIRDLF